MADAAEKIRQPAVFKGRVNPFAEYDDLCTRLQTLFAELDQHRHFTPGSITKRFQNLVVQIQGLVQYDADALMGAVHLPGRFDYTVRHPMQIAVLTELVLARLNTEQSVRLSTLCAALSANLAMNPYQKKLDIQRTPLTEQQKQQIHHHPLNSTAQLAEAGVQDSLWLQLVEQHHEKLDGSGYPRGLKGAEICQEARILALADVYSAMVTPRVYRGPINLIESLKDLFIQRGSKFDEKLTRLFINELGLYPPGVYVRLNNGELAVVVGRTRDFKSPRVVSIRRSDGNMHASPRKRDTSEADYAIKYVCDPSEQVRVDPSQLWGFDALRVNIRVDLSSVDDFNRGLI